MVEVGGLSWLLQAGGQRRTCDMDPLRWHFYQERTPQNWQMKIKQKNITSLWRGTSQLGRAESGKGEKEIGYETKRKKHKGMNKREKKNV